MIIYLDSIFCWFKFHTVFSYVFVIRKPAVLLQELKLALISVEVFLRAFARVSLIFLAVEKLRRFGLTV